MITSEIQEKLIQLIEMLMDELNRPVPEVEKLWIEESEKRYQAYKAGKLNGVQLKEIITCQK